jgi:CRP-like cAMP-binding protein
VRLLETEPDLGRFLDEEDRNAARRLVVPVRTVASGTTEIRATLERAGAFGAIVLEGMLLQRLRLADRTAIRLMGPGDIISVPGNPQLGALDESELEASSPVQLALLGRELLAAVRHWPGLVAGLQVRLAQQAERLSAQLVICQMPRVEDRLIGLLWLLAECWGKVTLNGTTVPLNITHATLGALIGARRPTVTLALGELAKRGAVISQDHGWLLIERPPRSGSSSRAVQMPTFSDTTGSTWAENDHRPSRDAGARAEETAARKELMETVEQLRSRHQLDVERVRSRLARIESSREEWRAARRRIARERVSRRQTPSS